MDRASLERSEKNGEESHPSPPANARHSDGKKRRQEEAEKNLPRRNKMARASLERSKRMEKVQSNVRRGKVHREWNFWYLLPEQVSGN